MSKNYIKFFNGRTGEYEFATVLDIGDIERLKTVTRNNLVDAINSIVDGGVPSNIEQTLADMDAQIDSLVTQDGLDQTRFGEIEQSVIETYNKVTKEMEEMASSLTTTYDGKLQTATDAYNTRVATVEDELDTTKADLDSAEANLETLGTELSNVALNTSNMKLEVDEINGKLLSKIEKTDFDLLETTVTNHDTAIKQNAEGVSLAATQDSLDLATERITSNEAAINVNAKGIEQSVRKEELRKEIDDLGHHAPNALRGTRYWDDWDSTYENWAFKTNTTYQHTDIIELNGSDGGMKRTETGFVTGETYTGSIWAKTDSAQAQLVLLINSDELILSNIATGDTFIGETWQRYLVSFVAPSETFDVYFKAKGAVRDELTHIAGSKIETGSEATGYRDHDEDVLDKLVVAEANIRTTAELISQTVQKLEKTDELVASHETRITQTGEDIELVTGRVTETEEGIKAAEASIKQNAEGILSKVEQKDIDDTVAGLSIDGKNYVRNSDFSHETDYEFWTAVSSEWDIVKDETDKTWISSTRTGLTADLPISLTSNLIPAVQGDKLTIGMDIKASGLDNDTIINLDLYDINDIRVDFVEFPLSAFQGKYIEGQPSRIHTTYKIDRQDVEKVSIEPTHKRNGSLEITNLSLQKGDITSYGWDVSPEDSKYIQAILKTEIDQKADSIELKAYDTKMDTMSGDISDAQAAIKVEADRVTTSVEEVAKFDERISSNTSAVEQTAKAITSKVSASEVEGIIDEKDFATNQALSEVRQTADGVTTTVSKVQSELEGVSISDVDQVSGVEVYSDKSQDALAHVEIDGKSEQEVVEGNPNLIKNGSFQEGLAQWRSWGTGTNEVIDESNSPSGKALHLVGRTGRYTYARDTYDNAPSLVVGKTYTLSVIAKGSGGRIRLMLEGQNSGEYFNPTDTFTQYSITFVFESGNVFSFYGWDDTTEVIMHSLKLEEGSNATPIPIPSPDYPSEIKSVENSIDIVSSVGGRNLFGKHSNVNLIIRNEKIFRSPFYILAQNNWAYMEVGVLDVSNITVSGYYKSLTGASNFRFAVRFYKKDSSYTEEAVYFGNSDEFKKFKHTFSVDKSVVTLRFYVRDNISGNETIVDSFKVEEGTEATSWSEAVEDVPYNSIYNTIYKTNILLDEPLRSVGDVKDELFLDNDGLWKVIRRIDKLVLNGDETIYRQTWGSNIYRFQIIMSGNIADNDNIMSSHFMYSSNSSYDYRDAEILFYHASEGTFNIFHKKFFDYNQDEFKVWLSENPVTIAYEMLEPIIETLPQSEQDKLNNIPTYKGQTYVYTVSDNGVEPNLDVSFKSAGWNYRKLTSSEIVNVSSKEALESSLKQLETEKFRVDAQFKQIYDNSNLIGSAKSNLNNAKTAYNTAFGLLVNSISEYIRSSMSKANSVKVEYQFTHYSDALSSFEEMAQIALDHISGKKVDDVSGELGAVEKRLSTAEQKITSDAIVSTVSSSTTFTNVQNNANSAKSTLDSKSGTWDSKASPTDVSNAISNGELYARGTGNNRHTNAIVKLNGSNIVNGHGRGHNLVVIRRSDLAVIFNQSYDTHGNSQSDILAAKIKTYSDDVICVITTSDSAYINSALKSALEYIGVATDIIPTQRVPQAYVGIPKLPIGSAIRAVTTTDSDAPYAEIFTKIVNGMPQGIDTTSSYLESRVSTAEQKITDSAIVSTVTQSSTYTNAMGKLVEKDKIASTINQTAQDVTINASKINLQGALTISTFDDGLKNDFNNKATRTDAQTYASTAEANAKDYAEAVNKGFIGNSLFSNYSSNTYPDGYISWSTGQGRKETSITRKGNNAIRFTTAYNTDAGMNASGGSGTATAAVPEADYYTVVFDFYVVSGTNLYGAGILLDFRGASATPRYQFGLMDVMPQYKTGQWYHVEKVVKNPKGYGTWQYMQVYIMANYSGLGTRTTKDIIYDSFDIRESTQSEIDLYDGKDSWDSAEKNAKDYASKISTKGLGMKVNYSALWTANGGELYMHGYDSNGNAADIDGYVIKNGEKITVSKGMINPGLQCEDGYIMYSTNSKTWYLAWVNINGDWYARSQSGSETISFDPAEHLLFLGTYSMDSTENFTHATLWNDYKDHIEMGSFAQAKVANNQTSNWSKDYTYIDGAKIYTGSITSNSIASNSITADKLLVADLTNYASWDKKELTSVPLSGSGVNVSSSNPGYKISPSIRISGQGALKRDIPTTVGEQVYFQCWIRTERSDWNGTSSWSKIRFGDRNGGHIRSFPITTANTSWQKFSGILDVPDNIDIIKVIIGNDGTGDIFVDELVIQKKLAGSLIVDGTIEGKHIKTGSLTADDVTAGTLRAKNGASYFDLNSGVIKSVGDGTNNNAADWEMEHNARTEMTNGAFTALSDYSFTSSSTATSSTKVSGLGVQMKNANYAALLSPNSLTIRALSQSFGSPYSWRNEIFMSPFSGFDVTPESGFGYSVRGTPLIENGTNANGDWMRFADGTQICWGRISLYRASGQIMEGYWNYPVAFKNIAFVIGNRSNERGSGFAPQVGALTVEDFSYGQTTANGPTVMYIRYQQDTANFPSGVRAPVMLFAIGRWK